MAQASKGTPGRRKKAGNENQYFDVGKVGRKTGITLKDTGVRDEHGMEPMSGIFSSPMKSPVSPQRRGDGTLTSSDMQMQESSAPEVTETILLRKTPKLPPPRALTPKHTNIGSPKRMSTGRPTSRGQSVPMESEHTPSRTITQPPANRVLDFMNNSADVVRTSIESMSPFKPKKALRRSTGAPRKDPFVLIPSPAKHAEAAEQVFTTDTIEEEDEDAEEVMKKVDEEQPVDDAPLILGNDDSYDSLPDQSDEQIEEAIAQAKEVLSSPFKRKPGRPRKISESANNSQIQHTPPAAQMTPTKKRDRSTAEAEETEEEHTNLSHSQMETAAPVQKRKRGRPSKERVIVHRDEGNVTIDPVLLAYGDEYIAHGSGDGSVDPEPEPEVEPKTKSQNKAGGRKPTAQAPKEREPNRAKRAGSSIPINDSPSKLRQSPSKRGGSVGPVSNVNLRASTPFEDAGDRVSRYGRAVMKPLNFWEGESYVWKNGEVEGVIRANSIEPTKKRGRRKTKAKNSSKGRASRLDSIDEESDADSVLADGWEEDVGVIAGNVAGWDAETQMGNPDDPIKEDLAFAASSIVTRDVAGSAFQYAKIMTLPFFGSGVVELPPEGYKRAKNSRKMQMVFFVHEGKVMVSVGGAGVDANEFAISKGGVWVVPRGNNYAITNESRTKTARIFFAQGCEN